MISNWLECREGPCKGQGESNQCGVTNWCSSVCVIISKNSLLPWLEALPVLTIFVPGLNEMSLQFYGVFEDLAVRAWKVPSPLQNQEDVALENIQRFVEAAVKSSLDQILSKKKNRVDLTTNQMLQFPYSISIFRSVLFKNWEGEIKQLEYFLSHSACEGHGELP